MSGMEEFLSIFGNITILQVVQFVLAVVFVVLVYRQVKKYFQKKITEQNKRAAIDEQRDKQLKEALDSVHQYPKYRQQSLEIQEKLQAQIESLNQAQEALNQAQQELNKRMSDMEEAADRRERNKLRDLLLQNYRHYINPETNPSHSWTAMEAETFWELFRDYEAAGGNGYIHTEVLPAMQLLTVVDVKKQVT